MELRSIEEELEAIARQYRYPASKTPDPAFSFMPRNQPTASSGELSDRGLRVDDLASKDSENPAKLTIRSSSPFRSDDRQSSKAVAGAMKALQDKIKRLEALNDKLKADIESLEEKLVTDRERWQQQSQRDLDEAKEREDMVLNRIRELEDDLRKQRMKDANVEEYVKSLTRQLQSMQEEIDEAKSTADLRERSLEERIEAMGKQIDQKGKEVQLLELNLQNVDKERSRLLSENTDLSLELDKITSELEYLKQSGESSASTFLTKMHENEQNSAKKIEECLDRIKDLEMRNQHLTEMTQAKEKQLEFLKQEIENLKRANVSAESARMASIFESEKARKLAYEMSITNERLTQSMRESDQNVGQKSNRKAKVRTTSASRSRSKSPKVSSRRLPPTPEIRIPGTESSLRVSDNEDAVGQIMQLEREMARYNEEYRSILEHADSMELSKMRSELNTIAEMMEMKSKELAILKRRHQSQIRSQVSDSM